LEEFNEELRFIFITSEAKAILNKIDVSDENNKIQITVKKSSNEKCVRCWHSRPEVGSIKDNEYICNRCFENVYGEGEVRNFA